jgi:hypothetical protein
MYRETADGKIYLGVVNARLSKMHSARRGFFVVSL